MKSLYEKCTDAQLKDAVKFIMKHKNYKPDNYSSTVESILESKYTLSDKQRHVLIGHLITNEKII